MTKVEKYVQEAIEIANDNSHGYSQTNRNGCPDYDCSSLVCAVVDNAGIPVKSKGASYTENMYEAFIMCGFRDVSKTVNLDTGAGLVRGDILLNCECHTCIYIGDGKVVNARTDTDCMCGDSHGDEIRIQSYWNFNPWNYVLRYFGEIEASDEPECVTSGYIEVIPCNNPNYPDIIKIGDCGDEVAELQAKLNALGYNCGAADGEFGNNTLSALKKFQRQKGLEDDGEAGPLTLGKLLEFYKGFTGKEKALEVVTTCASSAIPDVSAPSGDAPTGCECERKDDNLKVGDKVIFNGTKHYISSDYNIGSKCTAGMAKVTSIKLGRKHPIHLVRIANGGSSVYGWVDIDTVEKV